MFDSFAHVDRPKLTRLKDQVLSRVNCTKWTSYPGDIFLSCVQRINALFIKTWSLVILVYSWIVFCNLIVHSVTVNGTSSRFRPTRRWSICKITEGRERQRTWRRRRRRRRRRRKKRRRRSRRKECM